MDLPLFPLGSVLFPGMPLSLHIFEERYKLMINTCITEKRPFGVVLIEEGVEALGELARPHLVGCTAQITQVHPLNQGRMNLVAVGRERFRVRDLDYESQPYLQGTVEMAPMASSAPEKLEEVGVKLRKQVIRYLEILSEAGDVQFDPDQIPSEAMSLANLSAYLLRVEALQKQELLEAKSTLGFIKQVRNLYQREIVILETMLKQSKNDNAGPFSLN